MVRRGVKMDKQILGDWAAGNILRGMTATENSLLQTAVKDINELEKSNENYAYLFSNEAIFPSAVELASYRILFRNMFDRSVIDPHTLEVGTPLLYSLPENNQMQTVIFAGRDKGESNNEQWLLKSTTSRGRERGMTRSISTADFGARVSGAQSVSTRRFLDSREKLAGYLNINQFSRTSDQHIIILAESSVISAVTSSKVVLGNMSVDYGALFHAQTLKNQSENVGEFKATRHTNKTSTPFITFATNIDTLWAFLLDTDINIDRIYIIGTTWWTPSHQIAVEEVLSYAETKKVSINVVSTVAAMMNRDVLKTIDNSLSVYASFEPRSSTKTGISVRPIREERDEADAWRSLADFRLEYQGFSAALGVVRWIGRLSRVYFSSIGSQNDEAHKIYRRLKIIITASDLDRETKLGLKDALDHALNSKTGLRLDVELNEIGYGPEMMIVTHPRTAVATAKYIRRRGKRARVLDFNAPIEAGMYSEFTQIILINPTSRQRRRWLFAGLGGQIVCYYPESAWEFNLRQLQNDIGYADRIAQKDFIDDGGVDEIVPAINNAITDAKQIQIDVGMSNQDNHGENDELVEQDDFDEFNIERNLHYSQSNSENHGEQSPIVTVTTRLRFDEDKAAILLGTANGKIIRRQADGFESVRIDQIRSGDVIAYVRLDDSIDGYRKYFMKMSAAENGERAILTSNRNRILDFTWKRKFLNFVSENRLSRKELRRRFSSFGYTRSLGFFQAWSSPNKINFVPRDVEFIAKIGQVLGQPELIQHAEEYYKASQAVRDLFQSERQSQLERLEEETVESIDYPVSFLTVSAIENVDFDVNRSRTNHILEKSEEELRQ